MSQQYTTAQQGAQHQQTADGGQLPQQYRQVLDSVSQAVQVCGWCADQCIQQADPHMIECVRRCEDVVEIGETLLALAPRNSRMTGEIARAFVQAAQACGQECGQHRESHCQECATVLDGAAQSVQQFTGQQFSGQQFSGQQFSGQQTGTSQATGTTGQTLSM